MTNTAESKVVVGLDIGTSKVVSVIGEVLPDGVIHVMGAGVSPSKGVDRGGIVDLEAVSRSIQSAVEQAESISEENFIGASISLSGQHITSLNKSGSIPLSNKVTQKDIAEAMPNEDSIQLPENFEILHIIPQEYQVDGLPPTKNPLGFSGSHLFAQAHLITTHKGWLLNVCNAVESTKLNVDEVVFSGLASSYSVLTEDEKELGVCLIDIGGGTMDVVVYTDGSLRFSKSYPFAGNNITDHIAKIFTTSRAEAENIKINYGSAISPPSNNPDKKLSISGLGGGAPRIFTKAQIATVTSKCYADLFGLIEDDLVMLRQDLYQRNIRSELIAGIVLTGGSSQIEGVAECAKSVFDSHVRVGSPLNITGLTDYVNKPQYATVLGLLQYTYHNDGKNKRKTPQPQMPETFAKLKDKLGKGFGWVYQNYIKMD